MARSRARPWLADPELDQGCGRIGATVVRWDIVGAVFGLD